MAATKQISVAAAIAAVLSQLDRFFISRRQRFALLPTGFGKSSAGHRAVIDC